MRSRNAVRSLPGGDKLMLKSKNKFLAEPQNVWHDFRFHFGPAMQMFTPTLKLGVSKELWVSIGPGLLICVQNSGGSC